METVRSPASIGAVARGARLQHGWSQQQAADHAGVSRRFVNRLESGEHRNAELWRVLKLLEALGVKLLAATMEPSTADRFPPDQSTTSADTFNLNRHLSDFRQTDRT